MKNRTNKILELLTSEKRIEVSQLAEYLGVSQVTIRKDLDALEAKGIIKREHGHAVLCSTDDINGRIAYHYEEKKKIALKATELGAKVIAKPGVGALPTSLAAALSFD